MSAPSRRVLVVAVLGALALALPGLPALASTASTAAAGAPVAAAVAAPDYTVEKTGGATQLSDDLAVTSRGAVVYDSRSTGPGALRARETRTLGLFSGAPLTAPADATAVILNVTAVSPTSKGWMTVWPSDRTRPAASTLNFAPGTPTPNLAVVQLTPSRQIAVMNGSSGTSHVLVSFQGWVRDNGGVQRAGSVTPTDPTRVIDTRATGPAVPARGYRDVEVTGVGAPDGASAALLDVIAVGATRAGYLVAHPSDSARPNSTALTYRVGGDRAALSLMRLSASGRVRVWNMSSAPVHLVIDSFGWVAPGDSTQSPAATQAISPVRTLDTRASATPLGAANPSVEIAVPGDDKSSVEDRPSGAVLAVTATAATAGGYLQIDVDGNASADSSSMTPSVVNFGRGETVTNTTYVTVPAAGRLRLRAGTSGTVHAIVDVVGFVRPRAQFTGRLLTEDGGDPVFPGGVTLSTGGAFVASTSADGSYRVPLSYLGFTTACGRARTTAGAADPAYALACVGGTIFPTSMPLATGARVTAADIAVPRVGGLSGQVTMPSGGSGGGSTVFAWRTDGAYALRASVSLPSGSWSLPAVPAGSYLVSVTTNGTGTLVGETIDELPSAVTGTTRTEHAQRLAAFLAGGAKTFPVAAGQSTIVDGMTLLPYGTFSGQVVDPDSNPFDVTVTIRTESGHVVVTGPKPNVQLTRNLRPGRYTLCATEGSTTVCSGGASSWQEATPVTVESGATATTTVTLP